VGFALALKELRLQEVPLSLVHLGLQVLIWVEIPVVENGYLGGFLVQLFAFKSENILMFFVPRLFRYVDFENL